jgi:arylsulfatase A-like enzyme
MPAPPNILWLVTTQWRASALGLAGNRDARTPTIDALAAAGLSYTQAVTPHPFGPFARAALLTGQLSPANGVAEYYDPLPRDARTIAHELNDRGYVTAFFGKWHLAERDRSAALVGETHARTVVPPEARGGFVFWEGFEGGFLLNDPWLHGSRLPQPTRLRGYQSDVLTERVADWLQQQSAAGRNVSTPPWFVVLSLEAPHPPYHAQLPEGIERPDEQALELPANVPRGGEVERRARRELAGYYGHIAATDRSLGRLLRSVGESAMIVFTSVHGDMHGAHGLFRKGWPHEESIRVPLIVRGCPGVGTSEESVSLADLPAMAIAWADGRAWTCPRTEAPISMPSVVRLPDQCDRVWRGSRSARRKRITLADGTPWLEFDLASDPLEQRNLVAQSP